MTTLNHIKTRLEEATGPSRELDKDIARIVGGVDVPGHWHPNPSCWGKGVAKYTASLDAALALVSRKLPGWEWGMTTRAPDGLFRAYVNNGELAFAGIGTAPNPKRRWYEHTAPTVTLALLLCLISALSNQGEAG